MAKRKAASILIVEGVRETVNDEVQRHLALQEAEAKERLQLGEDDSGDDAKTGDKDLDRIFASFPSSKGWYAKLHRILDNGHWEVQDYVIENPEGISDLELTVKDIVHRKGWPAGTYVVKVQNYDRSIKVSKQRKVDVGEPARIDAKGNIIQFPQSNPVTDGMKVSDQILKTARELSPPAVSAADITRSVNEGVRSTIEMAKALMPAPVPPSSDGAQTTTLIVEMIRMIKDMVDKPRQGPDIMEVIKTVRSMEPTREDPLAVAVKLKDLGLIQTPGKTNVGEMLAEMKPIIELVTTMTGMGGGPEKVSGWGVVMSLGPQIIANIAKPIADAVEIWKKSIQLREMEVRTRMGGIRRNPAGGPVTSLPPGSPANVQALAAEIMQAAKDNDREYYPKIASMIAFRYGPQPLEGLASGFVTKEDFIRIVSTEVGHIDAVLAAYLEGFVDWLQEQARIKLNQNKEPAPEDISDDPGSELSLKCGTCGEVYDNCTEADLEDPCECGGKLQKTS